MKRICTTLLLGFTFFATQAQFTSTAVTNGCTPSTANPGSDIVNTQVTLNRIGHAESGTYGTLGGQWSAIGIPNITNATPNGCDLYGFTANWDSDRFFCGLKDNGVSDKKDAMIGWGDNDGSNTSQGPDRLIFSFFNTSTHQNNSNGTEVATMYPNGNVGIGSSFQQATPPISTLHVAGFGTFMGTNRDFRLTNAGGVQNNSILFVDQSTTGGWAGVMIKGDNQSANYPTLGFSMLNAAANTILTSLITGQPTANTTGAETGDLVFSVKPAAGQIAERVRIVGSNGFTGFNTGITPITQQIDVNGTARLRNIPANTPQVLLTGAGAGSDYVVNRLAFPGVATQVLLGNGTWGAAPVTATNGLSVTSGTVQLGQAGPCSATGAAALLNDRYIPMSNFNLHFVDAPTPAYDKNRIGIGTCTPTAKVEIVRPLHTANAANIDPTGLRVRNADVGGAVNYIYLGSAVHGIATGVNRSNYAGYFQASNANINVGVRGESDLYSTLNPHTNYGGWFLADRNQTNIGVAGECSSNPSQVLQNIGVSGSAKFSPYNIGVYGTTPNTSTGFDYAGYFNGDVYTTSSMYYTSDERYKTNIKPTAGMLEKLKQLEVKSYDFINEKGISFPTVKQVGIMAQNLEKVFPTLVKKSYLTSFEATTDPSLNKEIKAVNYAGLIPILVEAVKELDAKVTEPNKALEAELADLKSKYSQLNDLINDLCNNGCDIFKTPTTGSIKPASLLFQNIPNPFTKSTVINYSIADGAQKAEMLLSDMNGQPIQTIRLELSKQGTVSIPSDNLTVGTFTYSLIVDGKLIDTKKMMLTGN